MQVSRSICGKAVSAVFFGMTCIYTILRRCQWARCPDRRRLATVGRQNRALSGNALSARVRSSPLPARQGHAAKDEAKANDVKHLQWLAEQADCEQGAKQRDHVQEDAATIGANQF